MDKIILDVDTGVDDALAILMAVESGQLEIAGITAVNGNVPLEQVMVNSKKVLQLAGRSDIPVYRGAGQPLLKGAFHEFGVHGDDGIGGSLQNIVPRVEDPVLFAPDFMIEQAKKFPGELTLIMVGPLTNLALALRKEPTLPQLVKQVVVMGGLVSESGRGNTLPTSEFNIFADAEAAKIVFHSGMPIKLVSLDVTMKTFLTKEHIEQLQGSLYYDFVMKSTEVYRKYSMDNYGQNGCALHDPLTVGVVLDPSLVKTAKYFVDIETKSELSYGQTICDFLHLWKKEPNIEVCFAVDADRFTTLFLDTLKKQL
ncbi:MAG: nucleoside hydrolase [Bacillota bacterium]|uniref:nucleoside hydrolase n=1 Tax=Virgibacillus TaxID=84406 RepID=UPI000EF48389|nr:MULTISPECIES: nucleoside hydrolase [unclassified Virgibacillus]MCC2252171.1 nucleoside hydrolase [Virgibacillus sp. AGTR]MDY7045510.1 nucleoside hydrolase [Virgibacillus sp. M23]QRZ16351.1 nucleoside hydrolase [Virgibacillus sp. AGTR]